MSSGARLGVALLFAAVGFVLAFFLAAPVGELPMQWKVAPAVALMCGAAAWSAASFYGRSGLSFKEVRVRMPGGDLAFAINEDHRRVAWRIFVELATRVTTQRRDGDVLAALDSLRDAFGQVRADLKSLSPPSSVVMDSVEVFALTMLNQTMRPRLTLWHQRRLAAKVGTGPELDLDECARDIDALRAELRPLAVAFGQIAGLTEAEATGLLGPGDEARA